MKQFEDCESCVNARIAIIISLCLFVFSLIFARGLLPSLIDVFLDPFALYERGLSAFHCGVISILTTFGLMTFFSFIAGERLVDFDFEVKIILAGFVFFFFYFWIVLSLIF